jgi:tRNA threonylcarbamoyladenosine biosynthesis protein TsaE
VPTLHLASEDDTLTLGRQLATQARLGDVISLSGPLGAGKTVLARGFVRERLEQSAEVASPTFNLVHVYDDTDPPVWHFDLFRLEKPDEMAELGLDEALATGISLIEWPERAGPWLPGDRLDITLSAGDSEKARTATLTPGPGWTGRLDLAALDVR